MCLTYTLKVGLISLNKNARPPPTNFAEKKHDRACLFRIKQIIHTISLIQSNRFLIDYPDYQSVLAATHLVYLAIHWRLGVINDLCTLILYQSVFNGVLDYRSTKRPSILLGYLSEIDTPNPYFLEDFQLNLSNWILNLNSVIRNIRIWSNNKFWIFLF